MIKTQNTEFGTNSPLKRYTKTFQYAKLQVHQLHKFVISQPPRFGKNSRIKDIALATANNIVNNAQCENFSITAPSFYKSHKVELSALQHNNPAWERLIANKWKEKLIPILRRDLIFPLRLCSRGAGGGAKFSVQEHEFSQRPLNI